MARTKKPNWERLDLDYVRRRSPYRLWRRRLGWCAFLAGAGWIFFSSVRKDRAPYSSGPMSVGHELLADNCSACHTDVAQGVMSTEAKNRSMNTACLKCHQNSIGHDAVTKSAWHQWAGPGPNRYAESTLACASCHVEHEGPRRLVTIGDEHCVNCHADLTAEKADTRFAASITRFDRDHPEFRVLSSHSARESSKDGMQPARDRNEGDGDPGRLKFTHRHHLDTALLGPDGPAGLKCFDCHRNGRSTQPWRFARLETHDSLDARVSDTEPHLQGDYMEPIRYSLHCVRCHELGYDNRLTGPGVVPHDSPRAIRTFLWGEFTRFYRANPDAMGSENTWQRPARPTLRELSPQEEKSLLTYVEQQVKQVEEKLYNVKKVCLLCHEQQPPAADDPQALPRIVPPGVPQRWLMHAAFDHEKHRVVDCLQCHAAAADSDDPSDVLLPGVDNCKHCHAPQARTSGRMVGGVAYNCVLCHSFHQPVAPPYPKAGRRIEELFSGL